MERLNALLRVKFQREESSHSLLLVPFTSQGGSEKALMMALGIRLLWWRP